MPVNSLKQERFSWRGLQAVTVTLMLQSSSFHCLEIARYSSETLSHGNFADGLLNLLQDNTKKGRYHIVRNN